MAGASIDAGGSELVRELLRLCGSSAALERRVAALAASTRGAALAPAAGFTPAAASSWTATLAAVARSSAAAEVQAAVLQLYGRLEQRMQRLDEADPAAAASCRLASAEALAAFGVHDGRLSARVAAAEADFLARQLRGVCGAGRAALRAAALQRLAAPEAQDRAAPPRQGVCTPAASRSRGRPAERAVRSTMDKVVRSYTARRKMNPGQAQPQAQGEAGGPAELLAAHELPGPLQKSLERRSVPRAAAPRGRAARQGAQSRMAISRGDSAARSAGGGDADIVQELGSLAHAEGEGRSVLAAQQHAAAAQLLLSQQGSALARAEEGARLQVGGDCLVSLLKSAHLQQCAAAALAEGQARGELCARFRAEELRLLRQELRRRGERLEAEAAAASALREVLREREGELAAAKEDAGEARRQLRETEAQLQQSLQSLSRVELRREAADGRTAEADYGARAQEARQLPELCGEQRAATGFRSGTGRGGEGDWDEGATGSQSGIEQGYGEDHDGPCGENRSRGCGEHGGEGGSGSRSGTERDSELQCGGDSEEPCGADRSMDRGGEGSSGSPSGIEQDAEGECGEDYEEGPAGSPSEIEQDAEEEWGEDYEGCPPERGPDGEAQGGSEQDEGEGGSSSGSDSSPAEEGADEEPPPAGPADEYGPGGYHLLREGDGLGGGRYTAVTELGSGHFSTVWLALDTEGGQMVALKVVKANYRSTAAFEIDLLMVAADERSRCSGALREGGERVAGIKRTFEEDGPNGSHAVLVLPLMGSNLYDLISAHQHRGVAPAIVKAVTLQLLQGLHFLHDAVGVMHADLKPENILLTAQSPSMLCKMQSVLPPGRGPSEARIGAAEAVLRGTYEPPAPGESMREALLRQYALQIGDLGCSRWLEDYYAPGTLNTTPEYRSPECVLGFQVITSATDMWALACIVFELLTGQYLFDPKVRDEDQYDANEFQLMLMIELLGALPQSMVGGCAGIHVERYFPDGRFKHDVTEGTCTLPQLLRDCGCPESEAEAAGGFLMQMLVYDPARRARARDLLSHEWLRITDPATARAPPSSGL